MQNINLVTDKGIEFESTFKETLRMIDNLKSINISGVDIKHIQKLAIQIKSDCEKELQDKVSTSYMEEVGIRALAEQVYSSGIAKLIDLQDDLKNYDGYFKAYYTIKSMRDAIDNNDQDDPKQIKNFVTSTIFLLDEINHSNTRFYDTEKAIVEELYTFAYYLIKKEMFLFKSSTILTWVKGTPIARNFINEEVKKDIDELRKKADKKNKIEALITDSLKGGISSTYLSEELIYFISLYNDVNMDKIEARLESFYQKVGVLKARRENEEAKLEGLKERKKAAKQKTLINEFFKNAALTVSVTAAVVGVFVGTFKFANRNANKVQYMTHKEIYSESSEVQTPNAPEYMDFLEDGHDTVLLEYEPWALHYGTHGYSAYERRVYTYDLSEINMPNYEDYLDIDYLALCERTFYTESKHELDLDRMYEEAILEVVHYTQDMSDTTNPNPSYFWSPLIVGIVINAILLFASYLKTYNDNAQASWLWGRIYNLKKSYLEWIKDCKYDKEVGLDIKRQLEELRELTSQDQTYKQLFMDFLNTYEDLLPSGKNKEKYISLARKIKEKQN